MKTVLICLALAFTSVAQAGLIINTTSTDVTAYGFGTSPAILTLQNNPPDGPLEKGCVAPIDNLGGYSTSGCGIVGVGLVDGNNKYATPTLTELGVNSWANLAILFNASEPNNSIDQKLTLQSLRLTLYNGSAPTGIYFDLIHPYDLTNISQGQGKAGFLITIAQDQQSKSFNGAWRVGLAATIGCTTAPCDVAGQYSTGDGPDSFTIATLAGGGPQAVPEPATAALLGGGLIALALTLRRRRSF